MAEANNNNPEIGDLVWVGRIDTKAVTWIQRVFRKKALVVVPVPQKFFLHNDPAYRWVWFDNKTHLVPNRYLEILSKRDADELG